MMIQKCKIIYFSNRCNEAWAMGGKKCKESVIRVKEKHELFLNPPSSPHEVQFCSTNSTNMINESVVIITPPQSPAPEYQLVSI